MSPDALEELQSFMDDAVLVFEDSDRLTLMLGCDSLGSWRLAEMIDGMLDAMQSEDEVDDVLDLGRHLHRLAKRIKAAVTDHEQSRGEEP